MCCFLASISLIGPRFGILVWWLFDSARWTLAFQNFFFAFIGFLFLPWSTLAWVAVFPGGVTGFDWIILGFGILIDVMSYASGGYGERSRRGY